MSDIDLRSDKCGGTWTRTLGEHEAKGFNISLSDLSAHISPKDTGIKFSVDRQDVPSAWEPTVDVDKLLVELSATIARHMSLKLLADMIRIVRRQQERSFADGAAHARSEIRKSLGL